VIKEMYVFQAHK